MIGIILDAKIVLREQFPWKMMKALEKRWLSFIANLAKHLSMRSCQVFRLTRNMRLSLGSNGLDVVQLQEFCDWILKLGEGRLAELNDGESFIHIPHELLLLINEKDSIDSIAAYIYNDLPTNLRDIHYLADCAILCPTNEVVDVVNQQIVEAIDGEMKKYLNSDSLCPTQSNVADTNEIYTTELLNSIRSFGLPNHRLQLKIGALVMLVRNIHQRAGLCNGTRLQLKQLGRYVVEGKIITGNHAGQKVFVPRLALAPIDIKLPFRMKRRQFFTMTIHKSQGHTLDRVGIYLPSPVFTHGQFIRCSGLRLLIMDDEGNRSKSTMNVVYKEVFHNIS